MLNISIRRLLNRTAAAAVMAGALLASTATVADPLGYTRADPLGYAGPALQSHRAIEPILPDASTTASQQDATETPAHLRRRIVEYSSREAPGTIVVDTPNTYLYLVLGGGRAIRYGIGVGREGFTWSGVKTVDRKAEWPDWFPPAEMLARQPYLPRMMAGGPGNPLGARAMYIGGTVYRIHGTNAPSTIGKRVSSGCIRMLNDDVVDLYAHVNIGTKVVVLPMQPARVQSVARKDRPIASRAPTAVADARRVQGIY
jgi:lipoprotein-anchoring transpeptidase ErfK/SrfK